MSLRVYKYDNKQEVFKLVYPTTIIDKIFKHKGYDCSCCVPARPATLILQKVGISGLCENCLNQYTIPTIQSLFGEESIDISKQFLGE